MEGNATKNFLGFFRSHSIRQMPAHSQLAIAPGMHGRASADSLAISKRLPGFSRFSVV
jgi:hypothetical protein